jgi:hypothetical protein
MLAGLGSLAAQAATFHVTTTADNNSNASPTAGSLRKAILDANANAGLDTIDFNIPGAGVHTISLTVLLPTITDPVVIDGYTQRPCSSNPAPCSQTNTLTNGDNAVLLIELTGTNVFNLSAFEGLTITAGSSTVQGLIINGFVGDSSHDGSGIKITGKGGNVVAGNFIGTDRNGTAKVANAYGVMINGSADNIVGGSMPAARNVISGNSSGVDIENAGAVNNLVLGNFIGTDRNGTAEIANFSSGVVLGSNTPGTTGNEIGGTSPGNGNLISGNGTGVGLYGDLSGTLIQGNLVGTDVTGKVALGNGYGIYFNLAGSTNVIGGPTTSARNIISANGTGIVLVAGDSSVIQGNYIGTDITGKLGLGNDKGGVFVSSSHNTIGGGGTGEGNVISSNGVYGIQIIKGSQGNFVNRNLIGYAADSVTALGNNGYGIEISDGSNNIIGGSTAGANAIAFNAGDGVRVLTGNGNQIGSNAFTSNTGLAIDIGPQGVTPNDSGDSDTGPNNLQNYPVLTAASLISNGLTFVDGTLNSAPNTQFSVEFFANATADPTGFGEGQVFLGSVNMKTDANGNGTFTGSFAGLSVGQCISTTATDPALNTSEFSKCLSVTPNAAGSLQFTSAAYGVNENAGQATITVSRSGGNFGTVSVQYSTVAGGTATVGSDYTSVSGTLIWGHGDSTDKTFTIPILDDAVIEANETVNLALSNATNGTQPGSPTAAVLTIKDNDQPFVAISDVSQSEGNSGASNFTFAVSLSSASIQTVSVDYTTVDVTAQAGSDYQATNGTLTFAPGQTSKQINVIVNGDTQVEPDETFRINLLNLVNANLGKTPGIGTIVNDDGAQTSGTLAFSASSYNVTENGGQATVTVTRTGGSNGAVSIQYATSNGTAIAGSDYTSATGTLNWADGDGASKTFSIPITNDSLDESDETINLILSNPTGGATLGSPASALLTIVDDDPAPTVSIDDVSSAEGNTGTSNFTFTVSLSAVSGQTVSVNYTTADNTAQAGSDYQAANDVVSFAPGETSKQITVLVNGDAQVEPNETFAVNLFNLINAGVGKASGLGTIVNDDSASSTPTIQFSQASYGVPEGLGALTITVTRSGDTSSPASVDYKTVDGSAVQKADFEYAAGTLTFGIGETSKAFQVLINEDMYVEGNESFGLTLSNPAGASLGTQSSTSVSIIDDSPESITNPVDDAQGFVTMQYHDFLNREPDAAGLAFWTSQITACGVDQTCIDTARANVSAAFYLSIEFQQTGYLLYLMQKESFTSMPKYAAFIRDLQEVSRGVVVNTPGWQQKLSDNQQQFAEAWANRPEFKAIYDGMSNTDFVNTLYANAGIVVTQTDRDTLVSRLDTANETRAAALLDVATNAAFRQNEQNGAFVLMEYFGYLRRDPNTTPDSDMSGYNFWLSKLNQFGGNYVDAEMVRAFIISSEYRQRFGQ